MCGSFQERLKTIVSQAFRVIVEISVPRVEFDSATNQGFYVSPHHTQRLQHALVPYASHDLGSYSSNIESHFPSVVPPIMQLSMYVCVHPAASFRVTSTAVRKNAIHHGWHCLPVFFDPCAACNGGPVMDTYSGPHLRDDVSRSV